MAHRAVVALTVACGAAITVTFLGFCGNAVSAGASTAVRLLPVVSVASYHRGFIVRGMALPVGLSISFS